MTRRVPVMIGTDPASHGGIASVVRLYRAHGFFDRGPLRYLSTHSDGTRLDKAATAAIALLRVLALAARGRLALVHAHSASRASFLRKSMFLAVGRAVGAPTLFHLHGSEFHLFMEREAGPVLRWWIRRTLERSSAVIVLAPTWQRIIRRIAPGARIMVVPNPVELCPDTSDPGPGESHRVLFLGLIELRKGVFDLVAAVARLATEFPDLKLAVAGAGQLHRLRQVAAMHGVTSRLEILGWITPEQRAQELKRAAVLALPSYNEGLPMALLEAMAAGRPVVTTHVGGIPDVVHHEQEGLLVEAGDIAGLTAALGRLMRDGDLRQRLGRQARLSARAYSVDMVLERVSQIYESLGVA